MQGITIDKQELQSHIDTALDIAEAAGAADPSREVVVKIGVAQGWVEVTGLAFEEDGTAFEDVDEGFIAETYHEMEERGYRYDESFTALYRDIFDATAPHGHKTVVSGFRIGRI